MKNILLLNIIENRKNKNESAKKLNHTYYILGNENNISLTNKSLY